MMPRSNSQQRPRSVLLSFKFLGTALVGSLTMALVSTFAPLPAQIAVLGACVSILAGLFVAYVEQEDQRERAARGPPGDAPRPPGAGPRARAVRPVLRLRRGAGRARPAARPGAPPVRPAEARLALRAGPAAGPRHGRLLQHRDLAHRLRAAAREPGAAVLPVGRLGQDPRLLAGPARPAEHAAQLRPGAPRPADRADRDPPRRPLAGGEPLPAPAIRPWIDEQNDHGIWVSLVRESEIAAEPDLLADFGIYGDRAIGIQELDEQSRTLRFVLHFDRPEPPAGPRPLGAAVALRDPVRGPPGPGTAGGVGSDQRTWIGSAPPPGMTRCPPSCTWTPPGSAGWA